MQRLNSTNLGTRFGIQLTGAAGSFLLVCAILVLPIGCDGPAERFGDVPRGPHAGTTLTLSCPDARLRRLLEPMAKVWAHRTGATLDAVAAPMAPGDSSDLGILPFVELGAWAERGDLLPIPAALRDSAHPFQWSDLLSVYRGQPIAGWGENLYGVPIAGDGSVIVYRTDRFADPRAKEEFRKRYNRPLAIPTTWEGYADIAAFFADRDKRPSLPRFSADPARVTEAFFRVAACYDRRALGEADLERKGNDADRGDSLSLQFRLGDGAPRLDGPGFRAAATWLAGLKSCLPTEGPTDPALALDQDRAVMAVLTLEELLALRKGDRVPGRYGIAALPGTQSFADPESGAMRPSTGNYIPFFSGGWFGVVRSGCKKPDAAFDLLAELGGPPRSLELIASGGYGPTRDAHLEPRKLLIWFDYGFDEERSKALQQAMRSHLGKDVRNPAYGLRGPDQAALTASLGAELTRILAGEVSPADALKRAVVAWEKASAGTPPDKLKEQRRRAAGLN